MRHINLSILILVLLVPGTALLLADGGRIHRDPQAPPIKLGTSGSRIDDFRKSPENGACYSATLGSAVTCNGALAILSNNHVLALTDTGVAPAGTPVVQPGLRDTNCKTTGTIVADFAGDVVPIDAGNVDAALAFARPGAVDPLGEILDIGVPCSTPHAPEIGLPVAKSGRTTGLTFGTIVRIDVTVFSLRADNSVYLYTNQIELVPGSPEFVKQGDSGSLVVTDDANHQPVGLLFGASTRTTLANPAADIIGAFGRFCKPGGLAFAGRTCAAAAASPRRPGGLDAAEVANAAAVKERNTAWIMSLPSVVGVGIGASESGTGEAAIVVLLSEPPARRPNLPERLEGVRVETAVTGPFRAL